MKEIYPSELQAASLKPNSHGAHVTLFTENSWQECPAISFHSFGATSFQIDTLKRKNFQFLLDLLDLLVLFFQSYRSPEYCRNEGLPRRFAKSANYAYIREVLFGVSTINFIKTLEMTRIRRYCRLKRHRKSRQTHRKSRSRVFPVKIVSC